MKNFILRDQTELRWKIFEILIAGDGLELIHFQGTGPWRCGIGTGTEKINCTTQIHNFVKSDLKYAS